MAAFSVYWFVERPGIENLISRWKGLDKEKINALCKSKIVDRETEKLENLLKTIDEKLRPLEANTTLQDEKSELESKNSQLSQQSASLESYNSELLTELTRLKTQIEALQKSLGGVKIEQLLASKYPITANVVEKEETSSSLQYSANQTLFGTLRRTKSLDDLWSRSTPEQSKEIAQPFV